MGVGGDGAVVQAVDLTKRFGGLTAVDSVSFEVTEGLVFGLLGPNGAGKSTLLRMLSTLMLPTSGSARVAGYDIVERPDAVRRSIGLIPQARTSDRDLTAAENLYFYSGLFSQPVRGRRRRVVEVLKAVGLGEWSDELVRTFSGGMLRRLEIGRALLHRPKILFLDEPSAGLDPTSRASMWSTMRRLRHETGLTVFLTTHYMDEADFVCNRVAILDRGRIVRVDTPEALKASVPALPVIRARFENAPGDWREALAALPFVSAATETIDGAFELASYDRARTTQALVAAARARGVVVDSLEVHSTTLEDAYHHYSGGDTLRQVSGPD